MTIRIDPEDPTHVAGDPETYLNLILLLSLFFAAIFLTVIIVIKVKLKQRAGG